MEISMKKILSLLTIAVLTMFWVPTISQAQTFIQQSQTYVATTTATIQPTVPEGSFYSVHTVNWTTTGTVVGTMQLETCTGTATTTCSPTGASQNLVASGNYTLENTTAAYMAFTVTISTCTACNVIITYTAFPYTNVGQIQDGMYSVPLNAC